MISVETNLIAPARRLQHAAGCRAWRAPWCVLAVELVASGWGGPSRSKDVSLSDDPTMAPDQTLRVRAATLWSAHRDEDWATAFEFEDLTGLEGATLEEYVEWAQANEPFRVHEFTIGRVLTDGELGWVELDVASSFRRFPDAPVRHVQRWQTWQRTGGTWVPVQDRQAQNYPTTPALRDREAELALRSRCEAFWATRGNEDWVALLEFCEPADREQMEPLAMAESQGLLKYLSHEVRWVEATGDDARASVYFVHKLNDPNMTKAPPMAISIIEDWVKVDGQWYIDMIPEAQMGAAGQPRQETTP